MGKDRVRIMRILFFHFRFVTGLRVRLAPKYNRDDARGGLERVLRRGVLEWGLERVLHPAHVKVHTTQKIFHACQLKTGSDSPTGIEFALKRSSRRSGLTRSSLYKRQSPFTVLTASPRQVLKYIDNKNGAAQPLVGTELGTGRFSLLNATKSVNGQPL